MNRWMNLFVIVLLLAWGAAASSAADLMETYRMCASAGPRPEVVGLRPPAGTVTVKAADTISADTTDYTCTDPNAQIRINAAIAAVSAVGGGGVYFYPGTYSLNGSIVPASNVTLYLGTAKIAVATGITSGLKLIDANNVTNVAILGGTLDGSNGQVLSLSASQRGIMLTNCRSVLIDSVTIQHFGTLNVASCIGINFAGLSDSTIRNCFITDTVDGINASTIRSRRVRIFGNVITEPSRDYPLNMLNMDDCQVTGNLVRGQLFAGQTLTLPTRADWAADTATTVGDVCYQASGTPDHGYFFRATTVDPNNTHTGADEPTWNATVGGTTTDGGVTWTTYAQPLRAPTNPIWVGNTVMTLNYCCVPTVANGFVYECTSRGSSPYKTDPNSNEPNWPTYAGATTVDGNVTWTCRAGRSTANSSVTHKELCNLQSSVVNCLFAYNVFEDGQGYATLGSDDAQIKNSGSGNWLAYNIVQLTNASVYPDVTSGVTAAYTLTNTLHRAVYGIQNSDTSAVILGNQLISAGATTNLVNTGTATTVLDNTETVAKTVAKVRPGGGTTSSGGAPVPF